MRQEWLRAGDRTPACWACFLVYDDRVEVLAVIGPKEHVDRSMPRDAARKLWNELRERGWYRVSDANSTSTKCLIGNCAASPTDRGEP